MVPGHVDLQNQWITKEHIRAAMNDFMERYQDTGYRHKALLSKSAVCLVENYQSDRELTFSMPDGKSITYPEGTWFQGRNVFAKELRDGILSGEINGLSIGGAGDLNPNSWPKKA